MTVRYSRVNAERSASRGDFVAIPLSAIAPDSLCGVSLYDCDGPGQPVRLYRGPEYPITAEDIDRLIQSGRKKLYVSAQDQRRFQEYLRENLRDLAADETRNVTQRFGTLNAVVRDVLADALRSKNVDNTVQRAAELGETTVDLICRDDAVLSELCGVLSHDYYTFTHSANASLYAVMLAAELGIRDRRDLSQIASGALLHDLGKTEITESILLKPARLDDRERQTMADHPAIGFGKVCRRDDVSQGQLMMVYQHHECVNGRGYPTGVPGSEIHPWAKICTVVDVFEALTSNRPYRSRLSYAEAFAIMDRKSGNAFERSVYQCWKAMMTDN